MHIIYVCMFVCLYVCMFVRLYVCGFVKLYFGSLFELSESVGVDNFIVIVIIREAPTLFLKMHL